MIRLLQGQPRTAPISLVAAQSEQAQRDEAAVQDVIPNARAAELYAHAKSIGQDIGYREGYTEGARFGLFTGVVLALVGFGLLLIGIAAFGP